MLFICMLGGLAAAQTSTLPELRTAAATMTPGNLLRHIRELSSDAYDGRLPGTPGEEKSVAYVISQIRDIGLQPGTPTGGFTQKVPLYGTRSRGTLAITAGGKAIPMSPAEDFVLWSNLPDERIEVRDSDVVFAGYGVVAPEYQWNDYADIDVKGKTVIALTGDPPVADRVTTRLDERVFLGNALTVYGRTGTKLATAFNHGAAAVLLVPPAPPFRYVWENNARENMTLRDGSERQQLQAQALVSSEKAAAIFAATGNDFERARAAAAAPGFRAIALSARVTITVTNQVRRFESQNILAKIEGSDPALKNEYVIYSGHWDHHGREGDRIFHGASDNAAGTAGVLELARAFRSLESATETHHRLPLADGRGKRTIGIALLRHASALSSRLYRREYQSRLFQQLGMGPHQRFQHCGSRQFDSGRCHGRSRSTPGPNPDRRYGA